MNASAHGDDRTARELAGRVWYWYLIAGLVSIVFGIIVLSNVFAGLAALVWLTGFYLIYAGIIDLTSASVIQPRWLSALMGVIAVAGGVAALAWPGVTLRVLALVVGVSFIVWGSRVSSSPCGSAGRAGAGTCSPEPPSPSSA